MNASAEQLPLRDIHLPDPVSWWPPGPGWWLLAALLVVLPLLALWLRGKRRHPPLNRLAMNEFRHLMATYADQGDSARLVRDLSILLRRTAMSYSPRAQTASVTGAPWIEQLNRLSDHPVLDRAMADTLATAPYSPHPEVDTERLLEQVEQWLRGLPRRPSQ